MHFEVDWADGRVGVAESISSIYACIYFACQLIEWKWICIDKMGGEEGSWLGGLGLKLGQGKGMGKGARTGQQGCSLGQIAVICIVKCVTLDLTSWKIKCRIHLIG